MIDEHVIEFNWNLRRAAAMQIRNFTNFASMFFESLDEQDRPMYVAVVRGTFELNTAGVLHEALAQEPVVLADQYHGSALSTSVRVDTDLVPKKLAADVTLNANAFSPNGKPMKSWNVSVNVGRVSKQMRVTGQRYWRRNKHGWSLTPPEECLEVPLRYELSYGGSYQTIDEQLSFEENPIGRGFFDSRSLSIDSNMVAPQIEDPGDPIGEPDRTYKPVGVGPVPKHYLPRRALCGTADAAWQSTRWPLRPVDFDFRYYNCAPEGLLYPGYLTGKEEVLITGCSLRGPITFALPGIDMTLFSVEKNISIAVEPMKLDTLHIDLIAEKVYLTWRSSYAKTSEIDTVHFLAGKI